MILRDSYIEGQLDIGDLLQGPLPPSQRFYDKLINANILKGQVDNINE